MDVIYEPFDDRGEPGMYEHIYAGVNYTFRESNLQMRFRLYEDEPGFAGLIEPIEWSPQAYISELFLQAVQYLRANEEVWIIKVLDPTPPGRGFIPLEEAVEMARAAGLPVPKGFEN